jgi:hydroxylamine reductase
MGVCGKDEKTANLQDLLVYTCKGISMYAHRARELGARDHEIDKFIFEALFTTITNVNFDENRIKDWIMCGVKLRDKAKNLYEKACKEKNITPEKLEGPAIFTPAGTREELLKQSTDTGIKKLMELQGDVIAGLHFLLIYGLKGTAAYGDHAAILGKEDDEIYAYFHKALNFLAGNPSSVDELLPMILKCGEVNLKAMEILDAGNTETYGHPEPTKVRVTAVKGKCILASGHDLKDMEELLKQTEGKNINVYTHGEMLPLNAYPGLKKYKHLVGNYGGAWQNQHKEFDAFPGPILMTTNCIQKPKDTYKDRIFTCGLVGWPGVTHIKNRDFTPVIEAALKAEGFKEDEPEKTIMVGFGHHTVMSVADKVIQAVKDGAIKHFFLIGGCDGAKPGRNYYTDFAQKVPKDCVILTLACGKYRFNKLDFGDIGGIPRLLDMGQCNDAYSAIQVAVALAGAFNTDVNSLPLSMVLSWYEQKAVCILLTLLHLGIKNIRLGPSLPAFITPPVLQVLVDNFAIKPISTPEEDLKAILKN